MMCRFTFFVYTTLSIIACTLAASIRSSEESGVPYDSTLPSIIQDSTPTAESSSTSGMVSEETMIPGKGKTQEELAGITTETSARTPGDPCTNDNVMFVEDGETLYHCLNNRLVIFGCKLDNGAILSDGDTIVKDHYLLQCQINDAKDAASAVQIACHIDDRILGPGQTYVEGSEYFTCTWRNKTNDLLLEKSGCVTQENEKIKEGDTIINGYYQYKCHAVLDDPGTISMRFVRDGCSFENYPYKMGQIVIIGDYWYTCEKSTEKSPAVAITPANNIKDQSSSSYGQQQKITTTTTQIDFWIKPRGCIVDFGFLDIGEIFHKKGYVYKCEASHSPALSSTTEKNDLPADWPFPQVRRTMIGCLEVTPKMNIIEHFPGDQWLETSKKDPSQKYLVECSVDQKQRRLTKTTTHCYLDEVDGKQLVEPKTLKPGCMAITNNALWTCGKTTTTTTTIEGKVGQQQQQEVSSKLLLNAGLSDTIYAMLSGYQFC